MGVQSELLPLSVRNRRFCERGLKIWGIIWILTALGTFHVCQKQSRYLTDLAASATSIEQQAEPLREMRREASGMRAEIKRIQERQSWLTESDSGQTLQLLGIVSQAAAEVDGRINVQNMNLHSIERVIGPVEETPKRGSKSKKKPETEQRMELNLAGFAVDDIAVASFVAGLRDASVFESVELKSSVSQLREEQEARQYEVTCIY